MKKLILAVLAVALVAGFSAANEGGKSCPMGKKSMKCVCKGTVESVDAAAGKLVIKDEKGETMNCTVDAKTKIKINKKKAALADIAVGDTIECVSKGELAKSLVVKRAEAKK